jgi:hypothetical protein
MMLSILGWMFIKQRSRRSGAPSITTFPKSRILARLGDTKWALHNQLDRRSCRPIYDLARCAFRA